MNKTFGFGLTLALALAVANLAHSEPSHTATRWMRTTFHRPRFCWVIQTLLVSPSSKRMPPG